METDVSELSNFLHQAGAFDENGQLMTDRVQSREGHWFVVPIDADGFIVTFWAPPDTQFAEDAFRDDDGNVLMGVVVMHNGSMMLTPLDASLRPTIVLSAIVTGEQTTSANPGGWPLTPEELDREESPPLDNDSLPDWERNSIDGVARDGLGRLLTTRVKAADGQWADVVMIEDGTPKLFDLDLGLIETGSPSGHSSRAVSVLLPSGRVVVLVDEQGRPLFGTHSLLDRLR